MWECILVGGGWVVVIIIIPAPPRVKGSEVSVRPTDLRRSKEYVVYYHTWVWGFLTGRYSLSFPIYHYLPVFRLHSRGLFDIPEHKDILGNEENKINSE